MKEVFPIVILVLLMACGTQKEISGLEDLQTPIRQQMNTCIDDGTCSIEILPNSSMSLKKDAFGQLYGELTKSDLLLFKVTYERNVPKGLADADYRESFYFSIPKSTTSLQLEDGQLSQVNLVVERRCFCKGTAGFFKILSGKLELSIKKNELTLNGNFSHVNLPLLMTKIDEKVSLEP